MTFDLFLDFLVDYFWDYNFVYICKLLALCVFPFSDVFSHLAQQVGHNFNTALRSEVLFPPNDTKKHPSNGIRYITPNVSLKPNTL